ncbi:MAG TPA: hypothetical protein VHW01_09535 [Polyangiaceae bacterium]|jgi:hypothetical protein|nr:hypothetical protein [Polyangiaceae bacterium]
MSSTCRTIARAAKRRVVAPRSLATAMVMLEATCNEELEEMLAAIEIVHHRYCAECACEHGATRITDS